MSNPGKNKLVWKVPWLGRTEEKLRDTEERYRAIFDRAIDSVGLLDMETDLFVDFNDNACNNLGYTREEFSKLKLTDIDVTLTPERFVNAHINKPVQRTHAFETKHKSKNGELRDVEVSTRTFSINDKPFSMITWRDITANKQAERNLKESEERYRAIFDYAVDSILISDIDTGEILDFNRQAHENLGYTREEFSRLKISDFDPSFRNNKERSHHFRQQGLRHTFMTRNKTKSGEFRDIQATIQAIHVGGKTVMVNIWHDVTEQNKAQADLLESQEKFSKAFNAASDAMALIHARDGNFIAVNDNYVKVSGYSREELVGHNADALNMWGNAEQRAVILRTLRQEHRVSGKEFLFRVKSGELRICLFSAEPMSVGSLDIRIVVVQDITEQKKAEQAVRESEEMFSRVFHSASDAMVVRSAASGKFIAVNENYVKLTGYSREELINHSAEELNMWVNPDDKPRILGVLDSKGRSSRQEVFLRVKSGEIRTCLISAEPITVGGQKCFIAVLHDITEQKAAEQKVKDSEEKFSRVFASSPSAIVVTRLSDAIIIDVNESYTHFTGYTREEVIGHPSAEFKLWVDDKEREYFSNLLRKEGKFRDFELHSRGKSGEIRVGLASAEIINISGVPHRIVTIQDITERKEAEQRFKQASEEWQATFDSISDMVSIQDNDLRLVRVNQAYAEAVGVDRDALVGRHCYEVVHHADCPVANCPHQETLKTNKAVTREIFEPALGVYLQAATSPIFNESGHLIGTVHIAKDITERKKAEQSLKDSEDKFSKAFTNSADAICIVKAPKGKFLEVNDAYARFTGYTREELIGHTGPELGLITDEQERLTIMNALKAEGRYRNVEVRRQSKSGEIHVGLASGAEINLGGEICHLMSITDITELKNAEEALRDSEEKFSKAFRATPLAVAITRNKDRRYIDCNESFCRFTGYSRDEVIGHTPDEVGMWVDEAERQDFYRELRNKGRVYNAEFQSRTKSGGIRTFLASIETITIQGEPCRMIVLADISARKKAEEALKTNEENYRRSLDDLPLGISIVNDEDKIVYVNRATLALYGFNSLEELKAIPLEKRYTPESYAEYLERKKKRQQDNQIPSPIEVSIVRKDGQIRHLNAWRKEVLWDGKTQYQIIFQDVTERKKAEEALRDSEEKFSKAFKATPISISITSIEDNRFIEINDGFTRYTGFSPAEVIGHTASDLNLWIDEEERLKVFNVLRDKGRLDNVEFRFRNKSREIRTSLASSEPLTLGGNPCRMMVLADITERKKAEEALRDSEEKFSKAFRSTPNSVCITSNIDNRFIAANDGFSRSTGYSLDEVIGHSSSDLNLWVDEDERLKFFGELFEKGKVHDMEFKSRMKSGEIRTLLAYGEKLTIHGEPCRMIVSVDITERKKAEVALADSEKKLRIMFDSVGSGIAVADLKGMITSVNHRVLEMHGFKDDSEILGRNALDLVIPQQRQNASENFTRNLKERNTGGLEYTLQRKDGSTFLGECSVNILNDAAGAPVGYIAVTRDITQRKEIELALKESESKYATLVESSKDGIIIIQDGKIKFANSVMDKLSGYNSREYQDKSLFDLIPPHHQSSMMNHYKERTNRQLPNAREAELLTKDKRILPVEISVSMIEYDGRPAEMAVMRDISERKIAEQQLQEAYRKETEMRKELEVEMKRRAEFTRALVHELKTPVTPILASSDGLMEILEEEPAKSLAANVNRGAYNLNKRIDELLDVARSELNILNVTMSPVNIRPILKEVAAEMSVVAKKKAQALTLEVPHVLPKVNADYSRIKQVLDNLVTNAVKYTQKGGRITLSARESEGKLVVEVRDNGAGLNEEEMKKIFEPYYHKDNNAHQLSGLGLGLSLCKKFIELQGGEIWAESKPGKGSVFSFSLPVIPRK